LGYFCLPLQTGQAKKEDEIQGDVDILAGDTKGGGKFGDDDFM
jgi:hypothetical protein